MNFKNMKVGGLEVLGVLMPCTLVSFTSFPLFFLSHSKQSSHPAHFSYQPFHIRSYCNVSLSRLNDDLVGGPP